MDEYGNIIDSSHKYTDVTSDDYIGPGKAHHYYSIRDKEGSEFLRVMFQDGHILTAGVNGVMDENLLAIVVDRLRGFQSGPYACRENALALTKLEESLMWLRERTREREARGVEGTYSV